MNLMNILYNKIYNNLLVQRLQYFFHNNALLISFKNTYSLKKSVLFFTSKHSLFILLKMVLDQAFIFHK